MATIHSYEEIEAWKRARSTASTIRVISLRATMSRDHSLCDQVNRSIGSVMDNIAEGFERGGNKEFIQYLFIAKASAGETRSQLYRMLDSGYISVDEFNSLSAEILSISQLIMNFISYLKRTKLKGTKFS